MSKQPHRKPSLPHGWTVHISNCYPDRVYYFNHSTGATSWEIPELEALKNSNSNSHITREHIMEHSKNNHIAKKFKARTPSSPNIKDDSACVSSSTETDNCKEVSVRRTKKVKLPETLVKSPSEISSTSRKKISFLVPSSSKVVNLNKTAIIAPVLHKSEESIKPCSLSNITSVSVKPVPKSDLSPTKCQLKKRSTNNIGCAIQKKNNLNQLKKKIFKYGRQKILAPPITPPRELTTLQSEERRELSNRNKELPTVHKRMNSEMLKASSLSLKTKKNLLKQDKLLISNYPDLGKSQDEKKQKKFYTVNKKLPETAVSQEIMAANDLGKSLGGMKGWSAESAVASEDMEIDSEMPDVSEDLSSLEIFQEPMQIDVVSEAEKSKSYYIVVDTNILMHELKFVDELKDLPLEGCGPPNIVIPWVVIQELDLLKSKNSKCNQASRQKANEAVRYLYAMLTTKHPRIHGQTEKMDRKDSRRNNPEYNDDRITQCCSQLIERMDKEMVVLLTNDKNLCNKALIIGLAVYTKATILQHLKADLSFIAEPPKSSGLKVIIPVKKPETESELKRAVDEVICHTKVLLKHVLEPFLQKVLKEIHGKQWERMIVIKPPWSLLDILLCIKMQWTSIFGYIFTKGVLIHFETIYNQFKASNGYFCDEKQAYITLKSAEIICTQYHQKYHDKVHILQQIVELKSQCEQICENRVPVSINKVNHNADDASYARTVQRNVVAVFQYIWDLINHLCGVILDCLNYPHQFTYSKPAELPKKEEICEFLPRFYPSLHQLKSHMHSVLKETNNASVTRFYKSLVSFVSSLQIQVNQPPVENFSAEMLLAFCNNSENRDLLQNGFRQLTNFYAVINRCIHEIGSQDRMQYR